MGALAGCWRRVLYRDRSSSWRACLPEASRQRASWVGGAGRALLCPCPQVHSADGCAAGASNAGHALMMKAMNSCLRSATAQQWMQAGEVAEVGAVQQQHAA